MTRGTTTRCCSAFALILTLSTATAAQSPAANSLGLFPIRAQWTLPLNNVLTAPPAMVGARGYFPIQGDRLAAYDIEHGTLLWLVPAKTRAMPAVGDGLVYVVEPDALTAFQAATGSVAWRVPFNEPLAAPLVWDNGWLIGTAASGTVLAFRARDGGLIWRQELGGAIQGSAALSGDRIFVPMHDNQIIALKVETGEHLWTRRLGGAPNDILALDNQLFVGSKDHYFYSLRARDGFINWRYATGADVLGLPVADRRRVYFVSLDNMLRALERTTGGQRWKRVLPLRPTRGPVVAGNVLIVSGVPANSPAYLIKDGTPAGDIAAGGELATSPHVVPNGALPMVALVTRDIANGTVVSTIIRAIDPTPVAVSPLPGAFNPPIPGAPPTTTR